MALRPVYEALGYAARGWPVFPCDPDTKRPLIGSEAKDQGGFKLASRDPAQIREWWVRWPNAMIGVPTGEPVGAFVVDLDPKDGATAEGLLGLMVERLAVLRGQADDEGDRQGVAGFAAAIERELAAPYSLPPAPMVRTPRGGLHVWFAMPEGAAIGNRANVIPMVDVRGTGGYVILPPSVRRGPKARKERCDGIPYAWEEDAAIGGFDPPPAPPELIRFVTEKQDKPDRPVKRTVDSGGKAKAGVEAGERLRKYALAALDTELRNVERAGPGTRNDALNRAAFALGQLVGAGALSETMVEAALEAAADRNGLTKDDGVRSVRKTIASGLSDGIDAPRDLSDVARPRPAARLQPPLPDDDDAPQPLRKDGEPASRGSGDGGSSSGRGSGEPPDSDKPALDPEKLAASAAEPQNDTGNARRLMHWFGDDFLNVDIGEGQNAAIGLHYWAGSHWEMQGGFRAVQRFAQVTAERINDEADHLAAMPFELEAFKAAKAALKRDEDARTGEDMAAIEAADRAKVALGKRRGARRKFALSCGNSARLTGMIAQALPHMTVAPDVLDADPLAINCENGTLRAVVEHDPECPDDGCTGACGRKRWSIRLDPHDRADRISKVMPVVYEPGASCPKWLAFVERFQPRDKVRQFLQIYHGLGLTGIVEQAFVLNYGLGANGKSTFMEAIGRLMGSYAQTLPAEALTGELQRRGDQATPEFARLPGARLVRCAELPRGQNFRENTLKMLTGGEKVPVRHLHGRFFDLIPIFKAVGSCNEKPDIGGVDEGIWRRVKLVPWEVAIPLEERRPMADVLAEFDKERAGILNWLLDGLLDYLAHGLVVPPEVQAATDSYRADMDPLGEFIAACVERVADHEEQARAMYLAYKAWSHANSVKPYSEKTFATLMPQKGIPKVNGRIRKYSGVRLHDVPDDPEREAKQSGAGFETAWRPP